MRGCAPPGLKDKWPFIAVSAERRTNMRLLWEMVQEILRPEVRTTTATLQPPLSVRASASDLIVDSARPSLLSFSTHPGLISS